MKKEDFSKAVIISAKIPSKDLGVINDLEGPVLPSWVKDIEAKRNEKNNLLVIDGIDSISLDEQNKFKQILDTKSLNGYDLPSNMQIVILVKEGNRAKINREIQSLSLYYKVD